jgi:hypothetical protein
LFRAHNDEDEVEDFVMRKMMRWSLLVGVPLLVVLLAGSCGDKTTAPGDTTAPAVTTNLAPGAVTSTSVQLNWTAPGDDGAAGTARSYDIRYSTAPITAGNFASATAVSGVPVPAAGGTAQSVVATGLSAGTLYYFALKTADEVPNWSDLSNVVQATTSGGGTGDTTTPAAVTTLAAGTVTSTSVQLHWTASGDDGATGTAASYDIRYATSVIDAGNWDSATQVTGEPVPHAAGTPETMTVTGLACGTPYHFALKVADEVPNISGLSNVATGTTSPCPDTAPPAAITDLDASPVDSTDVLLTWTAPGDDGATGTASHYDIRYSTSPVTEGNWASAAQATGEPAPAVAATSQQMHVTGLHPGYDYYFAMKTSDEVPNASALSNVATAHMPVGPSLPPGLSALVLPDSVCISSNDQNAQLAKLFATSVLMQARVYSSFGAAFFAPLGNMDWQQLPGGCWDYTSTVYQCNLDWHVCKTGSSYEYTMAYHGTCFGQNDGWVAFRAIYDAGAGTGTFYMYEPNSTTVAVAWVWTEAADHLSGTYTFYNGDPATAAVQSIIEWSNSADGNTANVTVTNPGQSKWVGTFQKTPCSGTLKMYQWDDATPPGPWWLETDIAWNADGTGFYDTYDSSGTRQDHRTW